jgi:uncharacterized phage-associated protein
MKLKFRFNEEKAIETLVWLAHQWPGITPFYVAKILFYADKDHFNRYGRPIVADTFIAMPYGPVPSTVYDFIRGNYLLAEQPDALSEAVAVQGSHVRAVRAPNLDVFSESDLECLRGALDRCRQVPFGQLSTMTHGERAWREAPANGPMDYELFIDSDNPRRADILEHAQETAAYGTL